MDISALLATFGWNAPEPIVARDEADYGPLFQEMAAATGQSDVRPR
jgi:hypothetical protein